MTAKNNEIPEEFPKWAPPELIDVIRFDSDRGALLFVELTFCTHPAMEEAWRLLRKKFAKKNYFEFDTFVSEFSIQVYGAYSKREGYGAGTKIEHERKEKIVKAMGELATLLDSSPFDTATVSCFSKDELKGLYRILDSSCALPIPEDITADLSDDDKDELKDEFFVACKLAYCSISQQIDDGFHPYSVPIMPTLSDILMRYSKRLEGFALSSVIGNEKSTSKKGDDLTDLKYFIRVMSAFFKEKLGSPHYEILAHVGNAFFDGANLNKERVVAIVQDRRGVNKG